MDETVDESQLKEAECFKDEACWRVFLNDAGVTDPTGRRKAGGGV